MKTHFFRLSVSAPRKSNSEIKDLKKKLKGMGINLRFLALMATELLVAYENYDNPNGIMPELDDGTPLNKAFTKEWLKELGEKAKEMLADMGLNVIIPNEYWVQKKV